MAYFMSELLSKMVMGVFQPLNPCSVSLGVTYLKHELSTTRRISHDLLVTRPNDLLSASKTMPPANHSSHEGHRSGSSEVPESPSARVYSEDVSSNSTSNKVPVATSTGRHHIPSDEASPEEGSMSGSAAPAFDSNQHGGKRIDLYGSQMTDDLRLESALHRMVSLSTSGPSCPY